MALNVTVCLSKGYSRMNFKNNCELTVCTSKIDLAFLIDVSGSIRSERWPYIQEFIIGIIQQIQVGEDYANIAAVSWSDNARVEFDLDE